MKSEYWVIKFPQQIQIKKSIVWGFLKFIAWCISVSLIMILGAWVNYDHTYNAGHSSGIDKGYRNGYIDGYERIPISIPDPVEFCYCESCGALHPRQYMEYINPYGDGLPDITLGLLLCRKCVKNLFPSVPRYNDNIKNDENDNGVDIPWNPLSPNQKKLFLHPKYSYLSGDRKDK